MRCCNYNPKVCSVCGKKYKPASSRQKYCPACRTSMYRHVAHRLYEQKLKHPCPLCARLCKAKICQRCSSTNRYYDKFHGYIHLRMLDYPSVQANGTILEHRYVMEQKLSRQLKPDEVVHHLNGIRHDNRPQNLVIVTKHSHPRNTYIKGLQKRIRELEAQLAQQRF